MALNTAFGFHKLAIITRSQSRDRVPAEETSRENYLAEYLVRIQLRTIVFRGTKPI